MAEIKMTEIVTVQGEKDVEEDDINDDVWIHDTTEYITYNRCSGCNRPLTMEYNQQDFDIFSRSYVCKIPY